MKKMAGLTLVMSIFAIGIVTAYVANQKYAEYQQKKQTMAFLGVNEDNK